MRPLSNRSSHDEYQCSLASPSVGKADLEMCNFPNHDSKLCRISTESPLSALLTVKFLRKPLQGEAIPASLIVTIPASCDIVVPQPMQTSSSNDSINSLGWFGRLDTSMWIFKVQRNTLGGCCTCYAKHVIIDRTMANWRVTSMSSSILSLNTNWITVLEAKTPVPKQLQVDHFGCPNKKWRDWVGSNFTQHAVGLGNVVVAHLSIQSCEEGWPKLNLNIIQP